ncbi:Protoheme IX farnesyltransferase, mitochondrial [Coemansia sp. RSA 2336]|nr:Protoheme IX farnesyltransferase, mitochondrial [Coemansia sp. RSA 2336]
MLRLSLPSRIRPLQHWRLPSSGIYSQARKVHERAPQPWKIQSLTPLAKLPKVYSDLSKDKLTAFVVLTSMAGYAIAPGATQITTLLYTATGTALCAASANSFNQWIEIPYDAQMSRTRNRPLARHALSPNHALAFGIGSGIAGVGVLCTLVNPLTAALGMANIGLYAGVYTAMKRLTIANTWVGAVVGAIPPLMGWAAAAGSLDAGAWVLGGIMFAWQFPHFNSLAYTLRADYSKAGYRMMSVTRPRLNARVSLRYALLMFPLCAALPYLGITDWWFLLDSSTINGRFWADQIPAKQSLQYLIRNSHKLERAFSSSSPEIIQLPNIQTGHNPSLAHDTAQEHVMFTNVLTRPAYLKSISKRLHSIINSPLSEMPGPLQFESCAFGLPRVHFLRGCKGVGKSYLMFAVAAQLLIQTRNIRVIYIGDCNAWRQCADSTQRSMFLVDKLATAFIDSSDVQMMIDKWVCESSVSNELFKPTIVSLLNEIQAYCESNDLGILLALDNVDAVMGSDIAGQEVMGCIKFMKDMAYFTTLLAASDDMKADKLSADFHASSTWIRAPFTSTESTMFIRMFNISSMLSEWQLKKMLLLTWQYPSELNRLCMLLKHKQPEEGVDMAFREYAQTQLRASPQPFAAASEWNQPAEIVLDILMMSGHTHAYIDSNYVNMVSNGRKTMYIYPNPLIAKELVSMFCNLKDIVGAVEVYLEQMRRVAYCALL